MKHLSPWFIFAGLIALSYACNKSEPAPAEPAPAAPAAAVAEPVKPAAAPTESANDVFTGRCVPCHGSSGKGDGPAAAALTPKPRAFGDAEWQKSVTDEQIKQVILYGGAAVGKSAAMPSQPDLESKPEVLTGLIKMIRDFATAQ